MAASLKDTDSIVRSLEFGIGFVIHFIMAAVYLLVWYVIDDTNAFAVCVVLVCCARCGRHDTSQNPPQPPKNKKKGGRRAQGLQHL